MAGLTDRAKQSIRELAQLLVDKGDVLGLFALINALEGETPSQVMPSEDSDLEC